MAFKIAEGYVEVDVRYDRNRLTRVAGAAGRESGGAFSRGFQREFDRSDVFGSRMRRKFADLGDRVSRDFSRSFRRNVQRDLFDTSDFRRSVSRSMARSGEDAGERFKRNFRDSSGDLWEGTFDKDLSRRARRIGRDSGNSFSDSFQQRVQMERLIDQQAGRDIMRHLRSVGRESGEGFNEGFERGYDGTFITLNRRVNTRLGDLSDSFSSRGNDSGRSFSRGVVNAVGEGSESFSEAFKGWWKKPINMTRGHVAIIAGILTATAPVIGAAFGTGITLAFGAALSGLGLVVAAQSEKVQDRFDEMKTHMVDNLKKWAVPLEQTLIDVMDQATGAFDRLGPAIHSAFHETAPALSNFSERFFDAFGGWSPTLESLSEAFSGLLDHIEIGEFVDNLGGAFKRLFDTIKNNPEPFANIVDGLGNILVWIVDVTNGLSKMYVKLHDEVGPAFSDLADTMGLPMDKLRVLGEELFPFVVEGLKDLALSISDSEGEMEGHGEELKEWTKDVRAVADAFDTLDTKFRQFTSWINNIEPARPEFLDGNTIAETISNKFARFKRVVKRGWDSLWDNNNFQPQNMGIVQAFNRTYDVITNGWNNFWNNFPQSMPIVQAMSRTADNIDWGNIPIVRGIRRTTNTVKRNWDDFWNDFPDSMPIVQAMGRAGESFSNAESNITSVFEDIKNNAANRLNQLKNTASNIWDDIWSRANDASGDIDWSVNSHLNSMRLKAVNTFSSWWDTWTTDWHNFWSRSDDSSGDIDWSVNRHLDSMRKKAVNTFSSWWDTWDVDWHNLWARSEDASWDIEGTVTDAFTSMMVGSVNIFKNMKNGIGQVWKDVKEKAAEPVRFLIDPVYNSGLLTMYKKVRAAIPSLPEMKKANINFASGGVLPGYSPGRDNMMGSSPKGPVGLSGGEAIMRPEWTRAVGKSGVDSMNKMARSRGATGLRSAMGLSSSPSGGSTSNSSQTGFALGGILDGVKGFVGRSKDFIADKIGDLVGFAKKPFDKVVDFKDEFGKGPLPNMPWHVAKTVKDAIIGLFQEKDDEHNTMMGGYGDLKLTGGLSGNTYGGVLPHVALMGNLVEALFPGINSIGGVRPDALPWHPSGRSLDIMIGSKMGLGDRINSFLLDHMSGFGLDHTIWKQRLWRGPNQNRKMGDRGGPTQNHMDHIHTASVFNHPISKVQEIVKKARGGLSGSGGGGSGNTILTSFWDAHQPTASGKRMSADTIASSVIPMGTKLRVSTGGKSATGTVEDLGPASFVYRRHHPKALLDLAEPMMQKLTGRRSNVVNGSFKVLNKGSGRTLFGYTNWNGKFDPNRGTNGFSDGGIMSGSHDIGGMLPDKGVAVNRSGHPEFVSTMEQLKGLVNAAQNSGDCVHIHGDVILDAKNVKDFNEAVNTLKNLKKTARSNGSSQHGGRGR